jgi:hypothetical protein
LLVRPYQPSETNQLPKCAAPLTVAHSTREDGLGAVGFTTGLAVLARVANVLNGLESRSLADLVCFYVLANLDNDTCSFVACTLDPQIGHFGHAPVVEHEMNIAKTEAGGVELDQDIVGT